MTVTGEPQRSTSAAQESARSTGRRRDAGAVREVCPFLAADDAAWRSAYAAREHRCHAVQPPAPIVVAKQRQLCLVPAHASCATYRAALAVREDARPVAPGDDGAALWAAASPTPVVLEPARRMGAIPTASARSGGQALLIGLMVVAFLVLVIARTQSPAGSAGASVAPSAGGTVSVGSPSAAASTPAPTPDASASSTPEPTAPPSATPAATPDATVAPTTAATRTYKVKSGDTLSSIAATFGTTVKKIAKLNNIADPRVLRVGQVLQIP